MAPPSENGTARRAENAAAHEAMIVSLPLGEQGSARAADPQLADALNRLGGSLSNANSPDGQNPGSEG